MRQSNSKILLTPELLAIRGRVEAVELVLSTFPKAGPFNLVPDTIRTTPEYQKAKIEFNNAFQALRSYNAKQLKSLA